MRLAHPAAADRGRAGCDPASAADDRASARARVERRARRGVDVLRARADPVRRSRAERLVVHRALRRLGRLEPVRRRDRRPRGARRDRGTAAPARASSRCSTSLRRARHAARRRRRRACAAASRSTASATRSIRDGDPRATALLELLRERYAEVRRARVRRSTFADAAPRRHAASSRTSTSRSPRVARVLRLPAGAPLTLFAIGRTIGWIGHAIEQYATGQLIRPRAKYVGVMPVAREQE